MSSSGSRHLTLVAEGLQKTYGSGHTEVFAVRNASLELRRGEVVALLGPSGSGKSTLLTMLGLILPPDEGRIFLAGTPVFEQHQTTVDPRRFRRQHIGFVFQKANLLPFLTASENVRLAMEIDGVLGREAHPNTRIARVPRSG